MAALTAMKSMRQRLAGRQGGLTYEVEVVAQHAGERRGRRLPEPRPGAPHPAPAPGLPLHPPLLSLTPWRPHRFLSCS